MAEPLMPDEIAPGVPRFHPQTGAPMCACGKTAAACPELGEGHGWDPIVLGDNCVLCMTIFVPGDDYQRWGCGYAHHDCAKAEESDIA